MGKRLKEALQTPTPNQRYPNGQKIHEKVFNLIIVIRKMQIKITNLPPQTYWIG